MLFHASAALVDRHGKPIREVKPGEQPTLDTQGRVVGYDDQQMRGLMHGDVALMALDAAIEGDEKTLRESPAKWVKAIGKRDAIAVLIANAMKGDGWAELREEQIELLIERVAPFALTKTLAIVGPVLRALQNPPADKTSTAAPLDVGQAAAA